MGLKHVGRIKKNKRKVIVAYRTVPNESDNCIVVTTENLMADEHDTLIRIVESDVGQQANEFADAMARSQLPDGRNMLAAFHTTGKLIKVPTSEIEMTFDRSTVISLDELNKQIASQRGVSVEDLAITDTSSSNKSSVRQPDKLTTTSVSQTVPNTGQQILEEQIDTSILTDEQIAAKYRSDATRLYREAKHLREEAEKLSPSKKKTNKKQSGESNAKKSQKETRKEESDSGSMEKNIQ